MCQNYAVEYSFGKLKCYSTTPHMSGFLGSSPVSASRSPVSLAILNFFTNNVSMWVSRTPTPRKKKFIDVPVDRIPDIQSRLEVGVSNCPSWAAHLKIIPFGFYVFHAFTIYLLNRDTGLHWVRCHFN